MGGHTCALFGTKYPNQVKGIFLCAVVLKDNANLFCELPIKEDPEKYYPLDQAFKAKEAKSLKEILLKMYPDSL